MTDTVVAFLNEDADLLALLSRRIYPEKGPQGSAFPRIVYSVLEAQYDQTLRGPSGLGSMVTEWVCQSLRKSEAQTIAQRIEAIVGDLTGYEAAGFHVNGAWLDGLTTDSEGYLEGSDTYVYSSTLNLMGLWRKL